MKENNSMKKNILFINGHLNCGGVERSLVDILKNFDYTTYNVDLLLLEEYGDYLSEIPEDVNIKLIDLHNTYGGAKDSLIKCIKTKDLRSFILRIIFLTNKFFGIKHIRLAKKIFTNNKHYDIAIGFRPGICMNIAAFAVNCDKSIGWWHHGEYNLTENETLDFVADIKNMDKLICVSDGCKTMLTEKFPELADKFYVIPNMVDIEKVQEKSLTSDNLNFTKEKLNIVTVGRLAPEKHMENAVYAAKYLVDSGFTEFIWHIVGDGEKMELLINLINDLHLAEYVTLHGNQPNPYAYMKNADFLVHTSYVESQGLVVLEAMAIGTPCIITRSSGTEEFAVNEKNCILAEPNLESLISSVKKMIEYSEKDSIIKYAHETVSRYSHKNIMKLIYNI